MLNLQTEHQSESISKGPVSVRIATLFKTLVLGSLACLILAPYVIPQRHIVFVCNRRPTTIGRPPVILHPVLKISNSTAEHTIDHPGIPPGACALFDFRGHGGGSHRQYELYEHDLAKTTRRLVGRFGYIGLENLGDNPIVVNVTEIGLE
jgi:hypothetical protein